MTVQPGGTNFENASSKASHSGFQAWATLAGRTFQATGVALPRYTTLIDRTVKRSPWLVASRAKARRVDGQDFSVQSNSGAKHVVISSASRYVPDLAAVG